MITPISLIWNFVKGAPDQHTQDALTWAYLWCININTNLLTNKQINIMIAPCKVCNPSSLLNALLAAFLSENWVLEIVTFIFFSFHRHQPSYIHTIKFTAWQIISVLFNIIINIDSIFNYNRLTMKHWRTTWKYPSELLLPSEKVNRPWPQILPARNSEVEHHIKCDSDIGHVQGKTWPTSLVLHPINSGENSMAMKPALWQTKNWAKSQRGVHPYFLSKRTCMNSPS